MRSLCLLALACGALVAGGCASVSKDRGAGEVNDLLRNRGAPPAAWPKAEDAPAESTRPSVAEPLSLRRSVELAFRQSPVIREQYAALGLNAADVLDAGKLPDLGLEYSRLSFSDTHTKVTRGVSVALADLLLMRSRAHVAGRSRQVARNLVAARLLELERDVESAWYEHTAALQSAEARVEAARIARASAEYARRLHAAGNLPARALAQELASASGIEIAVARAQAQALETRVRFATLVGLSVRDDWRVTARLPALPERDEPAADLLAQARDSRPDIAAARLEVEVLDLAWRSARFWRWLGDLDLGYEWETEHGSRLRGPSFRLGLPLLHWNRAGGLRARAALESARARLAALEIETDNAVALGLDRLVTARRIAEVYRDALVPQREQVYARTLEEVNFMLSGAFEALTSRRERFEAWQEYIDAVRDYWLARAELRHASGGRLPALEHQETLPAETPSGDAAHDHGEH